MLVILLQPPSLILWQWKIGESRNSNSYGGCEGERRKAGRGRGEKKYACQISLFFWETPYAGKRTSWLVRHREVNWCLSMNCKSILFIPFPSVVWNWSGWECRVYYTMRKSKRFSSLVIRTEFSCSTKTYTIFTSCQNAACSNTFFFLASRLCSRGFYVLTEQMWF